MNDSSSGVATATGVVAVVGVAVIDVLDIREKEKEFDSNDRRSHLNIYKNGYSNGAQN